MAGEGQKRVNPRVVKDLQDLRILKAVVARRICTGADSYHHPHSAKTLYCRERPVRLVAQK